MVKNAGIATNISFQSIFIILSIIDTPTNIRIGAIAAIGTQATIGAINNESAKKSAADTAVRPVLPPASIPTVLSTYVVRLLVPNKAPHVVAKESQAKALSKFLGKLPFSSILNIPAFFPVSSIIVCPSNFQSKPNIRI